MNHPEDLFGVPITAPPPFKRAGNRRPSPKQSIILAHLSKQSEMTLDTAVSMIGGDIYHNAEKHVGALLSNMVRRGMIERVKPGLFTSTQHP